MKKMLGTKKMCTFMAECGVMSFFFGYFAHENLYYKQHII